MPLWARAVLNKLQTTQRNSAGAEVPEDRRTLPVEVAKSSLNYDDVSVAFGGLELDD